MFVKARDFHNYDMYWRQEDTAGVCQQRLQFYLLNASALLEISVRILSRNNPLMR